MVKIMSKIKNKFILVSLLSTTLFSGCSLKFYTPEDNYTNNINTTPTIKENVINDFNYNGNINYAPSNQVAISSEEIYKKNVTSSVYIISSNLEEQYLGSGVFFSEDTNDDGYAYILTNAHLVSDAISIEIIYSNYKKDKAKLVGFHVLEDIAILAVNKNDNYTIATVNSVENLEIASDVLTIGSPISTDYSFLSTKGVLSKINSPVDSVYDTNYTLLLLQIDATLNSGNSGGPLFDKYGNLIGINTMKIIYDINYNNVDDFNFSIPIDRALFIADKIFNKIDYKKGVLGITTLDLVDMTIGKKEEKNISLDYGLYVESVLENSASFDKIKPGDIITSINNKKFLLRTQFQQELYKYSKDDIITLTVYRNNEYLDFTITLK